ncbi:hypothetical protein QJS04_geneDACA004502 [Acorus gramineus]|uniref:Uncharacterized protein n=1 Tax=Acorus gramineus TaxID=55184 RepID=A0AAV9B0T5_ACOGR|nr:hypothetical protein QJS04_geneDACA004502 [Acorus gramineus]
MVRGFEFLHTKGVTIKTFDPKNVFLMTTEPPLVKIGGDFIHCGDSRKEEDFENLALYLEHCLNVFDIQENEFNRVLQILRSPPTNKSK